MRSRSRETAHVNVCRNALESHSANFIDDRQNAQKVYEAIQYAPAWVREGQATPQALAVISALQNSNNKAQSRGLPSIALACATDCSQSRSGSAGAVAQFDVALTVNTMRYLSNLRIGRSIQSLRVWH